MLAIADLSRSSEALLAARLLREEILLFPVPPASRAALRKHVHTANANVAGIAVLRAALERASAWDGVRIEREDLALIADAAGGGELRTTPGQPFEGRPSPPPAGMESLLGDLLERVNSPVAVESWPVAARAYALGYLLRLVQPFEAPAAAVAVAAEAFVLASDGFACDRVLLPGTTELLSTQALPRPDPDGFVHGRLTHLPGSLGLTLDLLRRTTGHALLLSWAEGRESPINARQLRALRLLEGGDARGEGMTFDDYVTLHAVPRGPSLRSLQRDWRGLRELGLLREVGRGFLLVDDWTGFGG